MIRFLIACSIFYSCAVQAEAILDLLKETGSQVSEFTLDKHLKKNISSLLPVSRKEYKGLSNALESKNYSQALALWSSDFNQVSFAKSSTGKALHAFLIFKNDYKILGLQKLFNEVNPKKINSIVYNLWKLEVSAQDEVWNYFTQRWKEEWLGLFGANVAFKVGSRAQVSLVKDKPYIEYLLSLPVDKKTDLFDLRWFIALHFAKNNNMNLSTKIMAWLLKETKKQKNKNQIYLTIARLLYDINETKAALYYYKQVKDSSFEWFLSQEEQSWIHYKKGNYSEAFAAVASFSHERIRGYLSSTMVLNLALMQLKNCHYSNLTSSIFYFSNHFLKRKKHLETILTKNSYKKVINDLAAYYSINNASLGFPNVSFQLKNDRYLKSLVLLRKYILDKQGTKQNQFKEMKSQQIVLLKQINQKIKKIIYKKTKQEIAEINKSFKWMNFVETEALYRVLAYHTAKNDIGNSGKQWQHLKNRKVMIYPFEAGEIWLDEAADYKSFSSEVCPQKFYIL